MKVMQVSGRNIAKKTNSEVAQKPTEGKWFEVNPASINQKLFKKQRIDKMQELTRQIILEAFAEVKNNPEKYAGPFETKISEKMWKSVTFKELEEYANNLGWHIADWVEQALEWAQRISNRESWTAVCNDPDTASWCRIVLWKNGYARIVGGSCKLNNTISASDVCNYDFNTDYILNNVVPLLVRYK